MNTKGGWVFVFILTAIAAGFFCLGNVFAAEKININTANLEELDTLPEIGPAKAQEIINYRTAFGAFQTIEDIMKVSGIKSATFEKIKDYITVGEIINAPLCGDGILAPSEECDDSNLINGDGCNSNCETEATAATSTPEQIDNTGATSTDQNITPLIPPLSGGRNNLGDVIINELVSDPADNEVEWIELFNAKNQEVDLSGWRLEDGSKAKTNLSGNLGSSGVSRYKVINKPAGNLNNSGDIIILYDTDGKIIDQVVYGNWPDGNLTDNAPVANDPASLARKFDGYNTYNNINDFAVTIETTKGSSNIIQIEDEVNQEAMVGFDLSSDIYFSEILPNPAGDDAKHEFIEIYNSGAREVNLTGWSLSNEDDKKINLEKISTSTIIKAGEYLVFFRPKTKTVLHNDQGQVKLFQPLAEKAWQIVKYKDVKEGWSYNLVDNSPSEWMWSETVTPGAINVVKAVNHAPEIGFSLPENILVGRPAVFDSSDTSDQDGDSLKFSWDFGDGFKNVLANPEHTFFKTGIYEVKLEVSDGKETAEKIRRVKVVNSIGEFGNVDEIGASAETPLIPPLSTAEAGQAGGIVINEIFPNPAGADTGAEWLEIKNQSADKINLANWRLANSNGKYKFKNDLWLEAEDFYLLNNAQSKLAFKNGSDIISLYNDLDELIDRVEYTQAIQGEALALGENGKWFWTTKLTPGEDNIISLAKSQSVVVGSVLGIKVDANDYAETALEKIGELEIGSLVKVEGTVAVEPGILGAQIFYIVSSPTNASSSAVASSSAKATADEEAMADKSSGIQIYNYKKDFPALKVGDYVEVFGELSQAQGEPRIKTKAKSDIIIKEHKAPPLAYVLSCDQVSEENVGQLISLTGEITSKKSSTLYLDDGSDEILVYIKQAAGISTKSLTPGQAVSVTGILGKTATGIRLLPRGQNDIIKVSQTGELKPQVLGEVAETQEWAIAERDKKIELFKYLLIIAGGVIIVLAGLFIKAMRKV